MPGLRDILDAATPGRWQSAGVAVYSGERFTDTHRPIAGVHTEEFDATLIALAPELAALCLDMKALLVRILDRDHHGDFINGENAKPEDVAALLARLDRIGKEEA